MKNFYVYILTNKNNTTLYVGMTNDLQRRLYEHKNELLDGFTKRYHLHKLVYFECVDSAESAIAREKQLKKMSRLNKEKLINRDNLDWKDLSLGWF